MSSNNNNTQTTNVKSATVPNPSTSVGEMQQKQWQQQQQQQQLATPQVQPTTVTHGQTAGISNVPVALNVPVTGVASTLTTGVPQTIGTRGVGNVVREPTIELFNRFVAKDTHCLMGKTGIKLSRICLGSMNFGKISERFGQRPGQLSEDEAHKILDRFLELGGNCIDTADFFPWFGPDVGRTETIIGNWLSKQDRQRVFLITKVRMPQDINNINSIGLSRSHIIDSVHSSLKRLQTDTIDMLVLNGWDHAVSCHDTVRHLDDLVRCDKIRYIGVCDLKGWQLQKMIDAAKELDLHRVVCYMGEYNLLTRGCELEVLDVCKNERIGFIAYSPLKYGFLTNETVNNLNVPPQDSRIEAATVTSQTKNQLNLAAMAESFEYLRQNPVNINVLNVCQQLSLKHNATISQIAIQWLLQSGVVTSVCIGVEDVKELEDCMRCLIGEFLLSQEDMDLLDMASSVQLHYPYHTQLADVAGFRELHPLPNTEFEQLNVLTHALGLGNIRQERLNLKETIHESLNPNLPEREFMRYMQMKANIQNQPITAGITTQQPSTLTQAKIIQ